MARTSLRRSTKRTTAWLLRTGGYQLERIERTPRAQFAAEAGPFVEPHRAQTLETVEALRERYRKPVFGVVPVWSVVEMQSHAVDRLDPFLMNVSQEIHVLQVLEGMIAENVDESLLLAALLHDVGKVLDLVGEDPANVGGTNEPIGEYEPGWASTGACSSGTTTSSPTHVSKDGFPTTSPG